MTANKTNSVLNIIIPIVAWIGFIYHMLMTQVLLMTSVEHQAIHLGFVLLIIFFSFVQKNRSPLIRIGLLVLILLTLFSIGYVKLFYEHLEEVVGFPEALDIAVGFILLFLVIAGSWMAFGSVFPIMTIILVLYFFLGHLMPHPLYHEPISVSYGISYLNIGLSGLFGSLLGIMANFGLLFMIFGSLLETGGANSFFFELGKAAGRILAGGPAQTAVVGSSLVGTVTGGAVANVIITGSFTIPMMKKVGFKPELAGAIEATASTGSQLMPPIMGVAAFLMAGILGISYTDIMVAGLIPALIYYFAVAVNVQLIAKKLRILPTSKGIDVKLILETAPIFIIPLGFLVVSLLRHKSPGYASFYAILLILIIACLRRSTRPSLSKLNQGVVRGFLAGARIAVVVGTVAILAQVFITTGLAQKLSALVAMFSGGSLILTLFFTMVLCIILGCGLPATAAYALVGILIAPSLIQMGVKEIPAHFFVFYFAIISAVTPPIALGSLAASSIAESNFWKTGWEAFKLAIPGFILPFLFIYNPVLHLQPMDPMLAFAVILSILLATAALGGAIYGYLFKEANILERICLLLSSVALFGFAFNHTYSLLFIGFFFLICEIVYQMGMKKQEKAQGKPPLISEAL